MDCTFEIENEPLVSLHRRLAIKMALKPDRNEHLTDLSFFMNETGERGKIVMFYDVTAGSGAAMDSANPGLIMRRAMRITTTRERDD